MSPRLFYQQDPSGVLTGEGIVLEMCLVLSWRKVARVPYFDIIRAHFSEQTLTNKQQTLVSQ